MPVFPQDPKIDGNANIITANSKDELPDPSTVPEDTIALVKSNDEVVVESGETLAWDGMPTFTSASNGLLTYYHVSDSKPTIDEMVGGDMNTLLGETVFPADVTADSLVQISEHIVFFGETDPRFIVVYKGGVSAEIGGNTFTFPKSGIYFFIKLNEDGSTYARSMDLTITGYNFKKETSQSADGILAAANAYTDKKVAEGGGSGGGGLPVLNFSEESMIALLSTGNATATAEETEVVVAAYENVMPILARGKLDNTRFGGVATLAGDTNGHFVFTTTVGTITISVSEDQTVSFNFNMAG